MEFGHVRGEGERSSYWENEGDPTSHEVWDRRREGTALAAVACVRQVAGGGMESQVSHVRGVERMSGR